MAPQDNQGGPPPDVIVASVDKPSHQTGFAGRIRNYFLTGLVLTGPVFLTFYLTWSFVTWVDDKVRPLIPAAYRPETYLPVQIPGLGLIIVFLLLTLLGFLTANLVGRKLVEIGETILGQMPFVRAIYKGLKQVFETLFSSNGSSFRKVGLVEFPSPGMWSLVFLSQSASAAIQTRLPGSDEYIAVFMPCTPNPTTGFFFYVQRSDLIELDITADAAASLIMTAGMIQPGNDQQKKLSALADAARVARAVRKPTTAAQAE